MLQPSLIKLTLLVILPTIIFIAALLWYMWPNPTSDIMVGPVQINTQNIQDLQQQVNQGHQPWRLDPLLVAQSELPSYGFTSQDIETLQLAEYTSSELGVSITELQGEIRHAGKMYLVTVAQPNAGQGNIWTIIEIKQR